MMSNKPFQIEQIVKRFAEAMYAYVNLLPFVSVKQLFIVVLKSYVLQE